MTRKIRRANIRAFAKNLNKNIPKSELWFRSLYKFFQSSNDEFNKAFHHTFIPDVINHIDKYVIEVDGSIHNNPEQQTKDRKKDLFYKRHGYTIIRVLAYDVNSFQRCLDKLLLVRRKTNKYYTHPKRINI